MKKIFLFLLLLFALNSKVIAASRCPYQEEVTLNQKAANVKASPEITTKLVHFLDMDDYVDVYKISILNLTEDFYVVITNNINDEKITLTHSDTTNNTASFE